MLERGSTIFQKFEDFQWFLQGCSQRYSFFSITFLRLDGDVPSMYLASQRTCIQHLLGPALSSPGTCIGISRDQYCHLQRPAFKHLWDQYLDIQALHQPISKLDSIGRLRLVKFPPKSAVLQRAMQLFFRTELSLPQKAFFRLLYCDIFRKV